MPSPLASHIEPSSPVSLNIFKHEFIARHTFIVVVWLEDAAPTCVRPLVLRQGWKQQPAVNQRRKRGRSLCFTHPPEAGRRRALLS